MEHFNSTELEKVNSRFIDCENDQEITFESRDALKIHLQGDSGTFLVEEPL